ncbi:MAG: aminoacyl-tRNA hydrolase [Candidatus Wildermuthbacteria bacterium]|nr:aminoacyl-tRNA hydrolase [Candidatus Wildermuthbacteria bacterium]
MILIAGLGNPGDEYRNTPHNAGFLALDLFSASHNLPPFSLSKKYNTAITKGILGEQKFILAKPLTFMNASGKSIASLASYYRATPGNIAIIHDDIDIQLGNIKISYGSGSAGQKGVQSIIDCLGAKDFTRIRVGIQPEKGKPNDVENFVLRPFSKKDRKLFEEGLNKAALAIETYLSQGLEKAMTKYNKT